MNTHEQDYPEIRSYTRGDVVFHLAGGALNVAFTLVGVAWLVASWRVALRSWYVLPLGLLLGLYVADFVTGFLHWAFDVWFNEDIEFVRRMVIMVREHHLHPQRIFKYSFYHDAGILSWLSAPLTAPAVAYAVATGAGPSASATLYALVCASVVVSLCLVFMLEFHKCGHNPAPSRVVKILQGLHLLLPYDHHMRHHSGNYDRNYCLINGYADLTLGALGIWRSLERVVSAVTGAVPQSNDKEWLRRYKRSGAGAETPQSGGL